MNDPVVQSLIVQGVEVVGGVLGALILWEVKKLIASKHLQAQASALQAAANAAGWPKQALAAAEAILAKILSSHGVKVTPAQVGAIAQAVGAAATADLSAAAPAALSVPEAQRPGAIAVAPVPTQPPAQDPIAPALATGGTAAPTGYVTPPTS